MKKILLLLATIVVAFTFIFAISASAQEPDTSREVVTLDDGTTCALWDTDGNGLIWYKTSDGYAYISAIDEAVDYYNGWNGGNQLAQNSIKITVDGVSYGTNSFVVANIRQARITSGQLVGNNIDRFNNTFQGCTNLEYIYVPKDTIVFGGQEFKSCSNLKYINIEELTELTWIGNQTFGNCSRLFDGEVLDLSHTKISSIGDGAFGYIPVVEIKLPSTLETVGQWSFQQCKSLVSVDFGGSVSSLNTNTLFNGCNELTTIKGLKSYFESGKATSIWNSAFSSCYKLYQIDGLIENGVLIIPEGIKEIGTFAFSNCDSITAIVFPSTINKINQQGFSYMDSVQIISFDAKDKAVKAAIASGESYTPLSFNNCGHFRGCSSLVAISMPEGLVEMNNRVLANCTSLTAVYMPNSVSKFSTNGGEQGPFCNSSSLYFVQDSFEVSQCIVDGQVDLSKLILPKKPEVYYMPTSLTTLDGHVESNSHSRSGTFFQNCTSINDVIVFGESFVNFNANAMFYYMASESSPKTVVFTGDINSLVTPRYARYITFVFANEADKSFADLGVTRVYSNDDRGTKINYGSYMYFCYDESKYEYSISSKEISDEAAISEYFATLARENVSMHLRDIANDLETIPTCTLDGGIEAFCFCGKSLGMVEVIPMTGHTLKQIIDTYYPIVNGAHNYYENRVNLCNCQSCTDEYEVAIEDTALFNKRGYSFSQYDSSTFSYTIYVNTQAIKDYSEAIRYGIVVSANTNGTPISLVDGAIVYDNKTMVVEFQNSDIEYSIITAKLTNVNPATKLHLSAYAIEKDAISYLEQDTVNEIANEVSYDILLGKYPNGKEEENR